MGLPRRLVTGQDVTGSRGSPALAWQSLDVTGDLDEAEYRDDPQQMVDALGLRLEIAERPAWITDAACREQPELTWFPDRGGASGAAKAVCVAAWCARNARYASALDGPLRGTWAGVSERGRKVARRDAA